jgi:predicted GNAT family acetyltransferase
MHIQHRMSGTNGLFYIKGDDEETIAKLTYALAEDGRMILEHTEVNEALRGQDIGYKLVLASVEHARKYDMRIVPVCPFTKAVFDKKPDFADVLA